VLNTRLVVRQSCGCQEDDHPTAKE
jgi:hypothetical protein